MDSSASTNSHVVTGLRPKKKKETVIEEGKAVCNNPVDRLCLLLLNWEFHKSARLAACTKTKDMPVIPFHHVPTVFQSYSDYIDVWEPLAIEEIRGNVLNNFGARYRSCRSKEFQFSLAENRTKDSNLIVLESQFLAAKNSISDSRYDQCPIPMDLLLFSPVPFDGSAFDGGPERAVKGSSESLPQLQQPPQRFLLGLITSTTAHNSGARTYQIRVISSDWESFKSSVKPAPALSSSNSTSSIRDNAAQGANKAQPAVKAHNRNGNLTFAMHYCVLENIRSNWREYLAIHELGCNIPLLKEILGSYSSLEMSRTPPLLPSGEDFPSPREAGPPTEGSTPRSQGIRMPIEQEVTTWRMEGVTDKFMRVLRSRYNTAQLYAIRTATKQMGFTLIQGPPGTGKTSTIIGILNAIHIREYNKHYEEALYTVLGPVGLNCRNSGSETNWLQLVSRLSKKKPHILVVAPSNVAVDNIIERIMEHGFFDGNGGKYNPNMLRVGGGKSPRVQTVSLEDTMKQEEVAVSRSADKISHLVALSSEITHTINEIVKCQTVLFDMKIAFDAHYPLPEGWELRMSTKTGLPYWVDHNLRRTSTTPPVIIKPQPGMPLNIRTPYARIDQLPEFMVHSHRMTQLIDQLDICNMKRTRLQTIIQTSGSSWENDRFTDRGGPSSQGREMLESSIIDSAQLLFTTLNSSGHPSMEATEFCVTVIDEAAQCVEPSLLIALRRGCKQCIMVGDQMQLPATTFSTSAKAAGYDRSLFERLIESGQPYIMLDTQYRMTPAISAFPSSSFYFSNLRDGQNVTMPGYLPRFLQDGAGPALFKPFMLFDLASSRETDTSATSKSNPEEAAMCVSLIRTLLAEAARTGDALGSIGVITPYNEQLEAIRRTLIRERLLKPGSGGNGSGNGRGRGSAAPEAAVTDSSSGGFHDIECNTVDGFQGREKDIIIISTVRANDTSAIGFLSDTRRMNVGLTRSKFGLYVVGHARTLSSNYFWNELIDHAKHDRACVEVRHSSAMLVDVLARHRERFQSEITSRGGSQANLSTMQALLSSYSLDVGSKRSVDNSHECSGQNDSGADAKRARLD